MKILNLVKKSTKKNKDTFWDRYPKHYRGRDTLSQGSVYIHKNSQKVIEENTRSEVDYDKIIGYDHPEKGKYN